MSPGSMQAGAIGSESVHCETGAQSQVSQPLRRSGCQPMGHGAQLFCGGHGVHVLITQIAAPGAQPVSSTHIEQSGLHERSTTSPIGVQYAVSRQHIGSSGFGCLQTSSKSHGVPVGETNAAPHSVTSVTSSSTACCCVQPASSATRSARFTAAT